jgi:hypothetical protein
MVKLNSEFLLTEKSTKEKMPISSESWVCLDIDPKIEGNEVSELGHSPGLIYSTAHSHIYGTGRVM